MTSNGAVYINNQPFILAYWCSRNISSSKLDSYRADLVVELKVLLMIRRLLTDHRSS